MDTKLRKNIFFTLVICAGILFNACATVPKESVDLSIELTKMIRSAEKSHLAMLDLYIGERKQRMNEFLDSTWTPDFMTDLISNAHILDSLKYYNSNEQKMYHLKEFSTAAATTIFQRRANLMEAIDKIDNMLRERVEQHYNDMLILNQTLTAHLQSSVEINEARMKILESLKIVPTSLLPLDKIGSVIDKMVYFKGEVSGIESFIDETKNILKEK